MLRSITGKGYTAQGCTFSMTEFKVGDRVRIRPGVATPFVGAEGIIDEVRPGDRGIATMDRHIVEFERREKRSFFGIELMHVKKSS